MGKTGSAICDKTESVLAAAAAASAKGSGREVESLELSAPMFCLCCYSDSSAPRILWLFDSVSGVCQGVGW